MIGGGGGSTNTLKIFRPAPSYLVSSLLARRSVRKVGSSDCTVPGFFPPFPTRTGLAGGCAAGLEGSEIRDGADEARGEEVSPIEPTKRVPINTRAIAPSDTAAMSLVRFSAPNFTYVVLR